MARRAWARGLLYVVNRDNPAALQSAVRIGALAGLTETEIASSARVGRVQVREILEREPLSRDFPADPATPF